MSEQFPPMSDDDIRYAEKITGKKFADMTVDDLERVIQAARKLELRLEREISNIEMARRGKTVNGT